MRASIENIRRFFVQLIAVDKSLLLNKTILCFCVLTSFLFLTVAQAQHKGINFQAVLRKSDGTVPSVSGVTVTAQILDPITGCVLREEEHSGKNISKGYLSLVLGDSSALTPMVRNPSPVLSITQALDNKTPRTGLKCVDQQNNIVSSGQTYIPSNLDRRILRIRLNISGEEIAADFNMRSVGFAVNSEMLNSKTEQDFVNINNAKDVTQANVESIFERFTKLDTILNGFNAAGTAAGINITGNAATATNATNVTGTVAITNGGTGATTAAGARTNLGLGTLATMSPTGTADNTTYLRGDGTWQVISGGGSGLGSVGLSLPSIFTVTNSPLTANGTISATLHSQGQSTVLAAPNGGPGTPSFRQLQVSDISNAKSAALYDVPVTGDAGTNEVVKGDDSRLVNARSPIDGSVTTAKIANGAVTDAKIDTVSGSKVTGSLPTGTLPVADSGVSGIVSAVAQSFSGLKTFLNGLSVSGNIDATGIISADQLKLTNSSTTCDGTAEGSIRYNSTTKQFEGCQGTRWVQLNGRTLLTSDKTIYVRTDGSDSNDGSANTAGGAFLTIQGAINSFINNTDLGGFSVTINIADGTYSDPILVKNAVGGKIVLNGSTGAIINVTTGWAIMVLNSELHLQGLTFGGGASSWGLFAARNGWIHLNGGHIFAQMPSRHHMAATQGGGISIRGSYSITGSAGFHIGAYDGGAIRSDVAGTITLTGSPAFTTFVDVGRNGSLSFGDAAPTFSGTATGKRYNIYTSGSVWTGRANTYLPGNTAGTVDATGLWN